MRNESKSSKYLSTQKRITEHAARNRKQRKAKHRTAKTTRTGSGGKGTRENKTSDSVLHFLILF